MTQFWRHAGFAAAAVLALTGCGNEIRKSPLRLATDSVVDLVRPTAPAEDARAQLTPDFIASAPVSVLLVIQQKEDVGFTLVANSANLGVVEWRNTAGQAILRRDGVVFGTRGFGFDRMTTEAAGLIAALDAGGADGVVRVERIINGAGVIEAHRYLCNVRLAGTETLTIYGRSFATRTFTERCDGPEGRFTNRYWIEPGGTVRRSVERITAELGDFEFVRLND